MATKQAAKAAPKTAAKKAAPKTTAKKAEPKAPELTAIDDGVNIAVGDGHADLNIKGRFDREALIAVAKRVERARMELS